MRVSTGMIYDSGLGSIQNRTSTLLRTQQQLSSGRRILSPSDDPVAAARALEVAQSKSANQAQAVTRDNVKSAVGLADAQLQSATDLLVRVRELSVQAGNASLSDNDRKSIALELRQRFDELIAIANSKDGLGNSLFGGFQVGNKPFAGSVEDGVRYLGDDGSRSLQVSSSRQMGVSQSGSDVFMRVMSGNGTFTTATQNEKSANASNITYEGTASTSNPPDTTGSFELRFWTDTAGGNAPSPAQSAGSVDLTALAYPVTFTNGVDDRFNVTIDGTLYAIDLDTVGGGTNYADATALVSTIQNSIGLAATVNLDVSGNLVFTSATGGTSSTLSFANVTGTPLTTLMGGVPAPAAGGTGAANTTYYDLIDSAGMSLFTGTESIAGGAGNTYTHAYTSGTPFALSSIGPQAFDYDASLVFTGAPTDGDSFTVVRSTTAIGVTENIINAHAARATIDAGTVSDPLKWSQSANSGDLEVRFWVDAGGTIATAGQTVGSLAPTLPLIVTAGTSDEFTINVDGAGVQTITLTPGTYATTAAIQAEVDAQIDALGAPYAAATTTLDADGRLVITSGTTGATSAVALAEGNGALARIFGAPTATAGTAATAGRTFYDLVDATTGKSLFTGTDSTTGGGSNTYTHVYASPSTAIGLSGAGGPGQLAFDFGASVTVSGVPAGGDVFTIQASEDYTGNGTFVTAAQVETSYNTGGGIIGAGEVLDASKWNHPANSRNLEVRFWSDPDTPEAVYYDLVDVETEKSLFTNGTSTAGGANNTFTHAFHAGEAIDFSGLSVPYNSDTITDFGISVTINGEPASGDAFKVQASESQSVFETLARTIRLLESGKPPETSGNVQLSNDLGAIMTSLSRAEDSILTARAVFGAGLAEVDGLDAVGESLDIQFEETLSRLQDLDYAEAITRLTRQQMELQAAQQSFSRISQLSLFDYIR
ncbi:MAG: flagellar hook-associated protein FlgL [Pseudomonadota bacterium]